MRRFSAALGVATMMLGAAACGDEGSSAAAASTTLTTRVVATTTSSTKQPVTTVTRPTTPTTTAATRTVALGQTFTIQVGESVSVSGAGLSVTYQRVVSDNRCPPGVQCIQAGNGAISVTVAKAGTAPASLTLNTTEGPGSAKYGANTVELVQLLFGPAPAARLKVS